jgi:tetratricopeptide (TPR) repeat protein
VAAATFFVSYTADDRPWAEWIAWQLEAAGHATVLQAWDFQVGSDFVHQMQQAVQRADRTLAVLSPAYLGSAFGEAEWRAAFAKDPTGERGLLVPVRVQPCNPPGVLSTRVYIDLVDLDEPTARGRLLEAVQQRQRPGRPQTAPAFPGLIAAAVGLRPAPGFPGAGPAVSNLAPRNPNFTGRAEVLDTLAQRLAAGTTAVVAAHGLGGVGKSQLALEYAYRHTADYDLVWWVAAETPLVAAAGLAALAPRLGLSSQLEQAEQVAAVLAELARGDRWLLVFDNAEQPQDLQGLVPRGGAGHVLVTSRNPAWGRVAAPLRVDVLEPPEATALLLRRTGDTDRAAAAALAGELDGLPLALEQAAAYCEQTSLPLAGYLARYRRDHARLLATGAPEDYPATVATTWRLNLERTAQASPTAVPLLRVCAFLAPEAIPPELLSADPDVLPTELAAATDEFALDAAVGALYHYSLLARDQDGLRLHRLVQAIVRDDLADQQPRWAAMALRLVAAGFPADGTDAGTWPACQRLLAHALAVTEHATRLLVDPAQTSVLLNQVGSYLRGRAQFAAARVSFEQALAIAEATYGPDHPEVATIVNNLGSALRQLGDLPAAKASFQRALRIDEAVYGPEHPEVATDLHNLSSVLQDLGDYTAARAGFQRALAIDEATLGADHTSVARDLNCLGLVLLDLGDLAGAKASFQRAVAIDEAAYRFARPALARSLNNLAMALHQLGDLDAAKANLERALGINQAAYGPDHPAVAGIVNNLGEVLQDLGDLVAARASYERALGIREAIFGSDHRAVSAIVSNLGGVLQDLGDLDGAHANYRRALAIDETALGPDHPEGAIDLNNLGTVLRDLGEQDGARAALQRAVAISTRVYGAEHPNTQRMVENLNGL